MKLALIGATGFVGSKILAEALSRGHQVTAIVRHPAKLQPQPKLTAKKGNVYDEVEIAALVAGHDAVISAFNPGWGDPDIYELHVKGSRAIYAGVKRAGVKRLLVVGGAGSLEVAPGVQLVDTPHFPAEYKGGARGAREALNLLKRETGLDWTFVSPPVFLEPGQRTGTFRVGGDQVLMGPEGPARISLEDLAMAIINEIEQPKHGRRRFTVGY